jgi:hypothetical protein
MFDPTFFPVTRFLGFIGLDAADVVRGALHKGFHEFIGLLAYFATCSRRSCVLLFSIVRKKTSNEFAAKSLKLILLDNFLKIIFYILFTSLH